jgi:hypothetical protein
MVKLGDCSTDDTCSRSRVSFGYVRPSSVRASPKSWPPPCREVSGTGITASPTSTSIAASRPRSSPGSGML